MGVLFFDVRIKNSSLFDATVKQEAFSGDRNGFWAEYAVL